MFPNLPVRFTSPLSNNAKSASHRSSFTEDTDIDPTKGYGFPSRKNSKRDPSKIATFLLYRGRKYSLENAPVTISSSNGNGRRDSPEPMRFMGYSFSPLADDDVDEAMPKAPNRPITFNQWILRSSKEDIPEAPVQRMSLNLQALSRADDQPPPPSPAHVLMQSLEQAQRESDEEEEQLDDAIYADDTHQNSRQSHQIYVGPRAQAPSAPFLHPNVAESNDIPTQETRRDSRQQAPSSPRKSFDTQEVNENHEQPPELLESERRDSQGVPNGRTVDSPHPTPQFAQRPFSFENRPSPPLSWRKQSVRSKMARPCCIPDCGMVEHMDQGYCSNHLNDIQQLRLSIIREAEEKLESLEPKRMNNFDRSAENVTQNQHRWFGGHRPGVRKASSVSRSSQNSDYHVKSVYVFVNGQVDDQGTEFAICFADFPTLKHFLMYVTSQLETPVGRILKLYGVAERKYIRHIHEMLDGGAYVACGAEPVMFHHLPRGLLGYHRHQTGRSS